MNRFYPNVSERFKKRIFLNGFKMVLQKPFLNPSKVCKRFKIGFFRTVFKKTLFKRLLGYSGSEYFCGAGPEHFGSTPSLLRSTPMEAITFLFQIFTALSF